MRSPASPASPASSKQRPQRPARAGWCRGWPTIHPCGSLGQTFPVWNWVWSPWNHSSVADPFEANDEPFDTGQNSRRRIRRFRVPYSSAFSYVGEHFGRVKLRLSRLGSFAASQRREIAPTVRSGKLSTPRLLRPEGPTRRFIIVPALRACDCSLNSFPRPHGRGYHLPPLRGFKFKASWLNQRSES